MIIIVPKIVPGHLASSRGSLSSRTSFQCSCVCVCVCRSRSLPLSDAHPATRCIKRGQNVNISSVPFQHRRMLVKPWNLNQFSPSVCARMSFSYISGGECVLIVLPLNAIIFSATANTPSMFFLFPIISINNIISHNKWNWIQNIASTMNASIYNHPTDYKYNEFICKCMWKMFIVCPFLLRSYVEDNSNNSNSDSAASAATAVMAVKTKGIKANMNESNMV